MECAGAERPAAFRYIWEEGGKCVSTIGQLVQTCITWSLESLGHLVSYCTLALILIPASEVIENRDNAVLDTRFIVI